MMYWYHLIYPFQGIIWYGDGQFCSKDARIGSCSFQTPRLPCMTSQVQNAWPMLTICAVHMSQGVQVWRLRLIKKVPSWERSHIPPWEKETNLQKCLGIGYVSSLEGNVREREYLSIWAKIHSVYSKVLRNYCTLLQPAYQWKINHL